VCEGYCPAFVWVWGSLVWTVHHSIQAGDRFRHHRHCHSTAPIRDPFTTQKRSLLAFKRSTKKRLKRFHRPAIPAVSEMTLSMSRGFTSSSERGSCVGRRPTVGEGAADEKFAFAISASYTAVQPDTIRASALSIPYASLPVLPPTRR
jgi:hypothetical protein